MPVTNGKAMAPRVTRPRTATMRYSVISAGVVDEEQPQGDACAVPEQVPEAEELAAAVVVDLLGDPRGERGQAGGGERRVRVDHGARGGVGEGGAGERRPEV